MRIDFSNGFEEVCEKELHITRKDVIRTVTNPLTRQTLVMDGLKVLLFLQKEHTSDTYLLVMGQCKENTLYVDDSCFRLLSELISKVGTEPIVLLQQLAFNFGVPIRIGTKVDKFFLREVVFVPKDAKTTNLLSIKRPDSGILIGSSFLKIKEVGVAECAIVFSIELNSYREWLSRQKSLIMKAQKYDVFISYKRNTAKDFAIYLKKCLTDEGYIAFLDLTDIPKEFEGTEKWSDKRNEAIINSKRFLLIITIKIESSREVAKELGLARSNPQMKFLYLRHDALPPQISIKVNDEVIDLGESNQIPFSTDVDLARKVLQILQDSSN
jgi:hypothetical protein